MKLIITLAVGYLLGCFPTAVVYSKLIKHDDIRNHGSGNPGTSNVIRTFGLGPGLIVLAGDMLKGVLGALIGLWLMGESGMYYGGCAAIFGHNWPIFMKFKGGKGVATSIGALSVIMPLWAAIAGVLFLIVTLTTRYFSVGSLSAITFLWIVSLVRYTTNVGLMFFTTLATVLVYYRHKENLKRLKSGTENKLGSHR